MATVKLTNKQVRIMWEIFGRMSGKTLNRKLAFAIAKNKSHIEHIVKALDEVRKPAEEYREFESKRYDIVKDFAKRDKEGNLKIINGLEYEIDPKKRKEFDEKVEALKAEYQEVIERTEKQVKEYSDVLDEEVEVSLHFINEDILPDEITPAEIEGLSHFIAWNDEAEAEPPTPGKKDKKLEAVK